MQLGGLGAFDDPAWPYVDENLQVADLPHVLQNMVDLGGPAAGGSRNRFKNRINNNGFLMSPTSRRSTANATLGSSGLTGK
ncbi:uncharacterized protein LOC128093291 isoform X2 [Culex pipiens pallens]|uniref:uncharacterized protein LOC128093291 isoform X2 n=1 Tax=Culex pipiens pallens TaxID=42434 RepID=UPI0022AA8836|nr:uncharacterized protein LOC128093291 isoform X2 [Culex pipiens pallens]